MRLFGRALSVYACAMLVIAPLAVAQDRLPSEAPIITNIRGDLYRVAHDGRVTVFLVTAEGIALGDPIGVEAAAFLKAEFDRRFPGRPVRYVLHGSHDFERAGGNYLFDASAEIVGHETFNDERRAAALSFPARYADLDLNRNRTFESTETALSPLGPDLMAKDRNGDGTVTIAEVYSYVGLSESTYRLKRTIVLGDRRVDLIHPGDAFGADMTVLYFPAERVVFASEYPALKALPMSFGPSTARQLVSSLRTIEELDFDLIVTGRGEIGQKADVTALRQYTAELLDGVRMGFRGGLSLQEVEAGLSLEKYKDWLNYSQRSAAIREIYQTFRLNTVSLTGGVNAGYLSRLENPSPSDMCFNRFGSVPTACESPGGTSPGAAGGVTFAGERFGLVAEVRTGRPVTGFRREETFFSRTESTHTFVHRDMLVSVLPRVMLGRKGIVEIAAVLGPSLVVQRSEDRFEQIVANQPPTVRTVDRKEAGLGFTTGFDAVVLIADRVSIVFSARFTRAPRQRTSLLGPWNTQVGLAAQWVVSRHVR